jgi:putative Ca2+/H+ antiporter (TMEM165/GDT1 family)
MEAFLTSTVLVGVAEIGDKTQLLSFVLSARLRRPWAILSSILCATLLNHALAAWAGALIAQWLPPFALAWLVGLSFIAFGLWALRPDTQSDAPTLQGAGAFSTAFVAFFLVEMGDKTQLATVALAARFDALMAVVVGTTLGMIIANAPAVWLGEHLAHKIPMRSVRILASILFVALGSLTLLSGALSHG